MFQDAQKAKKSLQVMYANSAAWLSSMFIVCNVNITLDDR